MPDFNTKTWIKSFYNLPKNDESLNKTNNSLEFILIWAIFEHTYLIYENGKSNSEQLVEIAKKYPVTQINVDEAYGFFHNRYIQHKKTTFFFNSLNLRKQWLSRVRQILRNQKPTQKEKLEFLLLIIYQFRCNLFHGKKDPLLLKDFDNVFYTINKFIAGFLDLKWKIK